MESVIENKIYKFTSLEVAKAIIIGQKLKFTNPFDFNDPFDCNIDRLTFDLSKTDEEFKQYQNRMYDNAQATHGEKVKNIDWIKIYRNTQIKKIKESKICCFSSINDHPLLWAHYGDKHLGACLIFDNALAKRFINEENLKLGIEGPVDYKQFEQVNYCESRLNGLQHLFGVKGLDWAYEKEFRIIGFNIIEDLVEFEPNFLKGIIFGMKVSNSAIEAFKKDIKKTSLNIEFKLALKNNESLDIIDWDFAMSFNKQIKVSALSNDPRIRGLFERLNSE